MWIAELSFASFSLSLFSFLSHTILSFSILSPPSTFLLISISSHFWNVLCPDVFSIHIPFSLSFPYLEWIGNRREREKVSALEYARTTEK